MFPTTVARTPGEIEHRLTELLNEYRFVAGTNADPAIITALDLARMIAAGDDVVRCPGSTILHDDPFDFACPGCGQQAGHYTDGPNLRINEHLRPRFANVVSLLAVYPRADVA